ncbi:MAG: molybdopterin molybdotransferase MoeA [Eubacteriaceae bacterium]|jgi:molybdopterin molybdotransferase
MYHEPEFEPDRDEMLDILREHIPFLNRSEPVPLYEADGRFAAEDIRAPYTLPNRDVSACDGIAVCFHAFQTNPDTSDWRENIEYCFSNTGVAVPDRFDTVIPIEQVEFDVNRCLRLKKRPARKGEKVRPAGSQMKQGEILVEKGEQLQPVTIGILAAAGYQSISVFAKPNVIFIPTGDELVPSGGPVPEGMNVECNSVLVSALIRRFGGSPAVTSIIPDDVDAIRKAIAKSVVRADLVVIGAGSSKGSKDYTLDVLYEMGKVVVSEIGVAPGKHCCLVIVDDVPVIGIPGPPGGAQLATQYYVKAALELEMTGTILQGQRVNAVLDTTVTPKWIDFMQTVRLYEKDGLLFACPVSSDNKTRAENREVFRSVLYCKRETVYVKGQTVAIEVNF